MKRALFSACFLAAQTFANPSSCEASQPSPQEALLLRRIGEYWKEGSYSAAKVQIIDFLAKYADSQMRDNLHAMLGDLYFQEGDHAAAIQCYDAIQKELFRKKTAVNHLKALYKLEKYPTVIDKAASYFKENETRNPKEETEIHYLLAEAFFQMGVKTQNTYQLQEALSHYQRLDQTKYQGACLLPMAEICRLLNNYPRGAALYLELSEKHPDKAEDFLFQAAYLQTHFDRMAAVRTFGQIYALGGKCAQAAAFNQLTLLFQLQDYKELIRLKDAALPLLSADIQPQIQFYIGRSYYEIGDFLNAVAPLETYISSAKTESSELKITLLSLFNCATRVDDLALFERTLEKFRAHFPQDSEGSKALILHAQLCLKKADPARAAADFETVLRDFPNYEEKETLLYDYALVLSQSQRWSESCDAFLAFLKEFPNSPSSVSAWRHVLNCSLEELKTAHPDLVPKQKEQIALLLHSLLNKEGIFSQEEKRDYQLLLSKSFYELGNFDQASSVLQNYIENNAEHPSLAEAHLLLASCCQKLHAPEERFIFHAEKALALNPNLPEKGSFYLQLFNAHLENNIEQAAHYLYLAYTDEKQPIKRENHLWLANHYYAKREGIEERQRAVFLFEKLFAENAFPITVETLLLEGEALKYSDLLQDAEQIDRKVALLEKLQEEQKLHPEFPWKYQRRVLFELAQAYEKRADKEKALATYNYLIESAERSSSFLSISALLHRARLEYTLLSEENKQENDPKIAAILDVLKDLQTQKKIVSEPIHLEAALEYAEIKSALSPTEGRAEQELFFLKRLKEDFTSSTDINSQEYTSARQAFPEKEHLVQSYLKFIDLKILQLEAEIATRLDLKEKAAEFLSDATSLLEELRREPQSLTPYLLRRVQAVSIPQG